jgi:hypothetical protein
MKEEGQVAREVGSGGDRWRGPYAREEIPGYTQSNFPTRRGRRKRNEDLHVADANERPIHDFAESWDCEPFDEEQMVAAMYLAFGAVKALAELCGVNACTAELI